MAAVTMISPTCAIILAGGQSSRMGRPKPTLMFGNCTILERLIGELGSSFDDIIVVAAPVESEVFPLKDLLATVRPVVRVLRDQAAFQGAAVALAQGLTSAREEVAFACSCDLPLLRAQVVSALREMLDRYDAVIPEIDGHPQPLCAVYRRTVAVTIEKQLASGERRLTRITEGLKAYRPGDLELRRIDPGLRSFMNINTPEDYNRALAIQRSLDRKG
jgi:molybdopterin-guanine dinucleotide biosynthesis protein A